MREYNLSNYIVLFATTIITHWWLMCNVKAICYLADAFKALADILLNGLGLGGNHADFVMDSSPIVVAGLNRSGRAKAVSQLL